MDVHKPVQSICLSLNYTFSASIAFPERSRLRSERSHVLFREPGIVLIHIHRFGAIQSSVLLAHVGRKEISSSLIGVGPEIFRHFLAIARLILRVCLNNVWNREPTNAASDTA